MNRRYVSLRIGLLACGSTFCIVCDKHTIRPRELEPDGQSSTDYQPFCADPQITIERVFCISTNNPWEQQMGTRVFLSPRQRGSEHLKPRLVTKHTHLHCPPSPGSPTKHALTIYFCDAFLGESSKPQSAVVFGLTPPFDLTPE